MDLIKIICGMLAVALFLGILTCGAQDERAPLAEEPDDKTVSEPASGITGEAMAEVENEEAMAEVENEKAMAEVENEEAMAEVKNTTTEQVALKPAPPNSTVLAKGGSEMATERREIENKVRATVRLLEAQGEGYFPKLVEPESPWNSSDFNVFVWTINGTQLVCPQDRGSEGKDMKGLLDADGKPIGELFIEAAKSVSGEGWIDYNWQESGSSEPSRMLTFVRKATYGEKSYIVGSSFYVDDHIICRKLSDCTSSEESGNILVAELLNPENIDRGIDLNYSVTHSIIEPGENIAPHMMKNPEVQYILEGEGILYIDGIPVELRQDQIVYIPAGAIQTTYNTGNKTLKFLAINQPGWSKENTEVFE
ncbi:MAG: cupin domain-containing protein [Methanosarcina sp.]|nr:cupin domain-containing protein [Methanosarcina sp.]